MLIMSVGVFTETPRWVVCCGLGIGVVSREAVAPPFGLCLFSCGALLWWIAEEPLHWNAVVYLYRRVATTHDLNAILYPPSSENTVHCIAV